MPKQRGTTVQTLTAQVESALRLLTSNDADAIIGERSPEYDLLIQGVQALQGLTWALAKGNGMRETATVLRAGAQGLATLCTIVHYAYALGIRRGMQRSSEQGAAEREFQEQSG